MSAAQPTSPSGTASCNLAKPAIGSNLQISSNIKHEGAARRHDIPCVMPHNGTLECLVEVKSLAATSSPAVGTSSTAGGGRNQLSNLERSMRIQLHSSM